MSSSTHSNTTQTDNSAPVQMIDSDNSSAQDETYMSARVAADAPIMGAVGAGRKAGKGQGKGKKLSEPTEKPQVDSAPVESAKASPVASASLAVTTTVAATPSKPRKGWKALTPSGVADLEASFAAAAVAIPLKSAGPPPSVPLKMAGPPPSVPLLVPLVGSPSAELAELQREEMEALYRADELRQRVANKTAEVEAKKEAGAKSQSVWDQRRQAADAAKPAPKPAPMPAKKAEVAAVSAVSAESDSDDEEFTPVARKNKVTETDKVKRAIAKATAPKPQFVPREQPKSDEEQRKERKAKIAAEQDRNIKALKEAQAALTRKQIQEVAAKAAADRSLTPTDREARSARSSPVPRASAAASVSYPVHFPSTKKADVERDGVFGQTKGPYAWRKSIEYELATGAVVTFEDMSPAQKGRLSRAQAGLLDHILTRIRDGAQASGSCTWEYLVKQLDEWKGDTWHRTTELTADMLGPIEGFLASQILMSATFLGMLCKALRELIPKAYMTAIPRMDRQAWIIRLTKFVGKHELESKPARAVAAKPAAAPKPTVPVNQFELLAEQGSKPAVAAASGKKGGKK